MNSVIDDPSTGDPGVPLSSLPTGDPLPIGDSLPTGDPLPTGDLTAGGSPAYEDIPSLDSKTKKIELQENISYEL